MTMPSVAAGKPGSWAVTGQTPATRPNARGQYVAGMLVHFTTGLGVTSTVFVPDAVYSKETIAKMVQAKASALDEVQGLSSSSKSS